MAPHSSTLAWKIPWTEEPGRLRSMGSLRVGHDWATSLSLFTFMHWRRKWQPTPSVLAWRIPGTGEPGGLPSMGLYRVGHDWSDLACSFPIAWFGAFCDKLRQNLYIFLWLTFVCVCSPRNMFWDSITLTLVTLIHFIIYFLLYSLLLYERNTIYTSLATII